MADISYKYWDNEHRIDSYDNAVSTYEWIRDALRFVFEDRNNLTLNYVISFDSEDMSYECKSIDEFKKYAFGKTIRVKTMTAFVSKNWIQTLVSIYANRSSGSEQQKFILSSEDEMLVISLRDALLAKKRLPLARRLLPLFSMRITVSILVTVIRFQTAPLDQRTLFRLSVKYPIPHPKKKKWCPSFSGKYWFRLLLL